MDDTAINEEVGHLVASLRQRAGLSARALASKCQEVGIPIDRNRMADIELARRRPVSVQELLGLAYVLRAWPGDLLHGEPPKTSTGTRAEALSSERYQAWAASKVALSGSLAVSRADISGWLTGTWPAWGDEPDSEVDPTLRDGPQVTADEAMGLISALASEHGLRVSFEPMAGDLGKALRKRSSGKR